MLSMDDKCLAPVFHSIPQDQVIKEGAAVTFTCTVHSKLSCWSVWDKDGIINIPSRRIVITESSNTKCLNITNVSLADSGFYRITVENDHGRVDATIQLKVVADSHACNISTSTDNAPIRVKRQLMKHSTELGMIVLAGQYQSPSIASLKVYSNDKMLAENDKTHVIVHNHSVIIIREFNTFGMDNYCCILQSISGKTTGMVAQLTATEDSNMLPPTMVKHLPPLVTSFEGCETDLQFEIKCNTVFTYVWLRNDVVIEDCHEFRYTDHGQGVLSLRIMDPFLLDSGVYKCIITSVGGSCKTQCRVKFDESNFESKSLPQIMLYPQSYVAEIGSAVIICAHVTPPNCNIVWKICGSFVDNNLKNFQIKSNADGLHFLIINKVNYNNCGEIQCMVSIHNHTMTTTASTMLTVIPCISNKISLIASTAVQEPYFLNTMKNFRVFTGTKLRLEVRFNGYPEPQVIWMRAGRPIEDTNASITTKPGHSILTINGINANQSGKYAAFIINNYGSDTMSASVSVEGPPDPPSGKPCITLDSQGMIVTWCGPPYDGGCVISGFLLEIKGMDDEWNVLAIVFDSLSYMVKNLIPNKSYSIRIRAKNTYGYSDPSTPSDDVIFPSFDTFKEEENCWSNYEVHHGEEFTLLYESLEELGRGRFGVVHKVRQRQTGDIRAAKMVKCIKSVDKKKVQEEIAIMRSLQHPKLLQLIQCFEASRETIMIVEYISGGELFERVVADDFTLTEKDCVMFMRQICEGVNYMHDLLVVHLDLKPENIMCSTRTTSYILEPGQSLPPQSTIVDECDMNSIQILGLGTSDIENHEIAKLVEFNLQAPHLSNLEGAKLLKDEHKSNEEPSEGDLDDDNEEFYVSDDDEGEGDALEANDDDSEDHEEVVDESRQYGEPSHVNRSRPVATLSAPPGKKKGRKKANGDASDEAEIVDESKKASKKYPCAEPDCDKVFNSKTAVRYHELQHKNERPYNCIECPKNFFTSSALKVHERLHSGEKPYKCEECGRAFRQWGDMKYHQSSIHSNEKTHQCEFCGKKFARRYSLVLHRKIHLNEKNHVCDICNKAFRASSYLQSHRMIHTGEKPYSCTICMKKFRCGGDMKRHQKTHDRSKTTSGSQKTTAVQLDEESSGKAKSKVSTAAAKTAATDVIDLTKIKSEGAGKVSTIQAPPVVTVLAKDISQAIGGVPGSRINGGTSSGQLIYLTPAAGDQFRKPDETVLITDVTRW